VHETSLPRIATGVRARIEATKPTLRGADARVAELLLKQPDVLIYQSVSEVADASTTSTATVVRFAQKLGFRGFHDLKLAVAQDLAAFASSTVDDDRTALERVALLGVRSIEDAAMLVSSDAFVAAVDVLNSARRILWVGVGTAASLAQDAAYRFRALGIETEAPPDVHVQHVASRLLRPEDACFAISHSGATRETLTIVEAARRAGARTVVITSFLHSPLTDAADIALTTGSHEIGLRLEAMTSQLAHLVVIDALLVASAELDDERSQRALDIYADVLTEHRF
jgi:DNA-binding MurR/RpiR family transcriptional regulator